jgi:hypothetical protein
MGASPALPRLLVPDTLPCGSGLAREEAITFNINVACQTAFASKPAPTF